MKSSVLNNFWEINNNIPYFYWVVRIGDFKLYKNNDEKIIDDAKIWCSIYWINSIEELQKTNKKIIIVIPALTWNSKVFDEKTNQWSGWANTYWIPWNILDPNKSIIIWMDYFGGPYDSSWPGKHNLNFYPVPPEKQVEAWKKVLSKLWIKEIFALFWGSNWWWHIHDWIFDNQYKPEYLIPVAWPIAPTDIAKEFFSLQVDFVKNKEDISERLEKNISNLIWESKLYDELIIETIKEVKEIIKHWDNKKAIKIVRQIGFLKFLNPKFFDRFYYTKMWEKIESFSESKTNMLEYFRKEWIKFEKRFSLSSLALLSQEIVDAVRISPSKYAEKIPNDINLIIVSIEDDKLFETKPMQDYFEKIKIIRKQENKHWKTIIELIESNECTIKAWHDSFLWPEIMQIISDKILKNIK